MVERPLHVSRLAQKAIDPGPYSHFMQRNPDMGGRSRNANTLCSSVAADIHAEVYAAGELKHGPLALVDKHIPVVAIASKDALFDKLKSNL